MCFRKAGWFVEKLRKREGLNYAYPQKELEEKLGIPGQES